MRLYRYWATEKKVVTLYGDTQELVCYGGSNISEQEASQKAKDKIEKIIKKITGDHHAMDSYEVAIREEIIREIDSKAVITRNRYGAQVLNVQDIMILDIDKPKTSFFDIFQKQKDDKTKIIEMVRSLAKKEIYQTYGLRIYETFKGIRVIFLGGTFIANALETKKIMDEFNCDALYTLLCNKQDCFRARLTPKPRRLKLPWPKVKFPRNSQEDATLQTWLNTYETASRNYSVCKFVEQIGSGYMPEAVRLHDEMTGAYLQQNLA